MRLFSYKLIRDYGFAPNPFPPYCTLATCKPIIRLHAQIGDWVVGIGSCAKDSLCKNKLLYAMKVEEKISYDEYWEDLRFFSKRPVMNGSKKQLYGDNIYHRLTPDAPFIQENSHHSLSNGAVNLLNYNRDVPGKYVLISKYYWYFGQNAIDLPKHLDIIAHVQRGYRVFGDPVLLSKFSDWISSISDTGYHGRPLKFDTGFERYSGK